MMDSPDTECSICAETFIDPRLLPCGHTFCLKCLTSVFSRQPDDRMLCPLCRNEVRISKKRVDTIPQNIAILQLIEKEKMWDSVNDFIICEACTADDKIKQCEIPTATMHCTTCEQSLCERCSLTHKRQKVSKDHNILPIDEDLKRNLLSMIHSLKSERIKYLCDCCKTDKDRIYDEIPTATMFCIKCEESHCDDCSRAHKKQTMFRDHEVVPIDESMKKRLHKEKPASQSDQSIILCDPCNTDKEHENDQVPSATMFCIKCEESHCNDCSRAHKKQTMFRDHEVVPIDDSMKKRLHKEKPSSQSDQSIILCDPCNTDKEHENDQVPSATMFCTKCEESHCNDCSRAHKKQTMFRDHEVVPIDDSMKKRLHKEKPTSQSDQSIILCDPCNTDKKHENDQVPSATMFCTNCEECHCDDCSRAHKKQKMFRDHEVVPIDDSMKKRLHKEKSDQLTILCDPCNTDKEHKNDPVPSATMFCTNCKESHCANCSRVHKKQILSKDHKVIPIYDSRKKRLHTEKLSSKPEKSTILCDPCNTDKKHENDPVPSATMFCTNCGETLCADCRRAHKKQNLSKDHEVLPIDENMKKRLHKEKLSSKSDKDTIACDSCRADKENENEQIPPATMHCTNCKENHCDDCSKDHKKQNLSKDHKVVPIDEDTKKKFSITKRRANETPAKLDHISSRTDGEKMLLKLNKLLHSELRDLLKEETFSQIRHMVKRPIIKDADLEHFWRIALPYIIQRIKTWNGYVLSAQNIAAIVERTQKQKKGASSSDYAIQDRKIYPISRLDCISYIINAADSIVVQDILRIMSKFPMAIPLVIPDMKQHGKYIVVFPAMQNITVKWESTPGQIAENHLFSSPYRMIVAVRLGVNKVGKSSILNQLMKKQFLFSSCGEPGSRYGRPLTLDGSVEIAWLTQETCSDTTWKTTLCDHYKRDSSEVAILANLHGDALQYPDTLKYLEHLACSFIVFRMPNSTDDEFSQLRKSLSSENLVQVMVDPTEILDEESEMETIYTASLQSDDTQDTVRSLVLAGLTTHSSSNSARSKPLYNLEKSKSLRYTESLQCKRSEEMLDIVRKEGCINIKTFLLNIDVQQHTGWNESLKRLIKISLDIFNRKESNAKKSLTYLENQLSQLSADESVTARAKVREANEKLRRIMVKAPKKSTAEGDSEERQYHVDLKKAQAELKSAMDKVDNINLGQEHFFRALGQMYEKSFGSGISDFGDFNAIRDLPNRFADLLISGHAIEMLNGDSGEIQLVWIKAICNNVTTKFPNLKVFVISIIGLQSSGKSTLLNALFSCRFAVSVGRCSRGLFMRMILIDEELRKTYGCDAVILIDTEGLCSPEKMNDPKASQKDRLMATFAMGVSNLTMVNILGEGMTEMTEVLQMAIVAMARLRVGGIKPDILMIQHLQERNLSKIDQAKGQFCEAINKACELISKNDVEIGAASEDCLTELTARIQSGDIFAHFGAFRDGSSVNSPPSETYHEDVVNLFQTLLKRAQALDNKTTFERWSNHFESYWGCVREENFALNFKNVKHITDFLYFEKKIAKVKELNDSSLRHHREFYANKMRNDINLVIENKQQRVRTDSMRTNMLRDMEQKLQAIPHDCPETCRHCIEFKSNNSSLLQEIESTEWGEETKTSLKTYNDSLHKKTMQILQQTFDGSVVKQGYFSEFSDLITKELNKALEGRPTGLFSTVEQRDIVDNTWRLLQGIAASKEESIQDLKSRMDQALLQTYVITANLPDIIQDLSTEITVEDLSKTKAIKYKSSDYKPGWLFVHDKLNKDQLMSLISDLKQLVASILQSRREDYLKTGLDFDEGMVSEIKTNFPTKMKDYEEKYRITLHDKFKIKLQMYTLQQLRKRMTGLQAQWNSQNRPSEILEQKKDDYINEIETRLKYGFSCAGEGEIVAKRLCKSVKLNAIQAGYDAKIQAVKNNVWTTNSEKVRLHYFEKLAKEVAAGDKKRALEHFDNPKRSIESWFANEVDSLRCKESIQETYHSTLKRELNRVKQLISNSDNKADINKIVKEQIKNADDQYYSQLDMKDDDFDAFRSSIVRILDSFMNSEDSKNADFGLVSNDPDIKRRLGCCEHCYWCGALCWGGRDHQTEKNSNRLLEVHHSCHQPDGLKGTNYQSTKTLSSTACHNNTDDTRVIFGEFGGDGILWSVAKRDHFKEWRFDAHCDKKFDELMRWFFQELHRDIAERKGLHPPDVKRLGENGCIGLNLDKILEVVRSKI